MSTLKSASVAAVVPLFNHQRYVAEAIRSLLDQTLPVKRIFIVDDGSTDASLKAVGGFSDSRITVLSQANAGAHAAINRGIEAARDCEYVTILNSDDFYTPDRVQRCLEFLQSRPEYEMVFTGLDVVDAEGRKLGPAEPRAKWFAAAWAMGGEGISLVEWLGKANFAGTTSNLFARRDYLLRHPFAAYQYVHDYRSLVSCALAGKLGMLPDPLLCYRVHSDNTITLKPRLLAREVLRMNIDLLREIAPRLLADASLRSAFAGYQRAAWDNVSSFHAGVFTCLVASLAAEAPTARVEALLSNAGQMPELEEGANRALLTAHQPGVALNSALGDRFAELREERVVWRDYARLLESVSRSRWLALQRTAGGGKRLAGGEGKTVLEKYTSLRGRLMASRWLALGARLGITSAKALRDPGPSKKSLC